VVINVSEEFILFIFRIEKKDEGDKFLRKVGNQSKDCT
jgi:hypothetical protein